MKLKVTLGGQSIMATVSEARRMSVMLSGLIGNETEIVTATDDEYNASERNVTPRQPKTPTLEHHI